MELQWRNRGQVTNREATITDLEQLPVKPAHCRLADEVQAEREGAVMKRSEPCVRF